MEKSVEKSRLFVGKTEKVFSRKGIFPISAGCGKTGEKPMKRLLSPVENPAEKYGKRGFFKPRKGKRDDKSFSTTT
ncbi:MAG: hypothetical protein J6B24_09530 [Clostridia bacterium]|nr:hypothetical protein [Clostridia bacterium]